MFIESVKKQSLTLFFTLFLLSTLGNLAASSEYRHLPNVIKTKKNCEPVLPPPIPHELRNVPFIARWIIFGTYFNQYITNKPNSNFIDALDISWNREIQSIVGSSTFKKYLNQDNLNQLRNLLESYKNSGQTYINSILSGKPISIDSWLHIGNNIALFFDEHGFDPMKELEHWFKKATTNVSVQATAYFEGNLATFFSNYGSSVRNFQEIGFTLSPTPCKMTSNP